MLTTLGLAPDARDAVDQVVARVYADVDPAVRGAARQSVAAQLAFLAGAGAGDDTPAPRATTADCRWPRAR